MNIRVTISLLCFGLTVYHLANQVNPIKSPPKYMVKLKDTIYHCEEVMPTPCGYYISCGKMSLLCASNVIIEEIP